MEKAIKIVIIAVVIACASCCSSREQKKSNPAPAAAVPKSMPARAETPKETAEITGRVETDDENALYIVEKWQTRSRITHRILNAGDYSHIQDYRNKIIRARAEIVSRDNPYTGTIRLVEILEIKDQD